MTDPTRSRSAYSIAACFQILASHPQTPWQPPRCRRSTSGWRKPSINVRSRSLIRTESCLVNPVRAHTEKVLCLHEHKPELRAVNSPGPEPLRRARENRELRLRDHTDAVPWRTSGRCNNRRRRPWLARSGTGFPKTRLRSQVRGEPARTGPA